MRIFLDLDGVLANFTKAACAQLGEPYPSNYVFEDYSWLFDKYGDAKCYSKLRGHLYWETLELYPWAHELVEIVKESNPDEWMFLTKPMADPFCFSGKYSFVKKHFPKYANKLTIISGRKDSFVRDERDILIDDYTKNINLWEQAGGSTFFWKEISDDFDKTLVDERLKSLKEKLQSVKNK